MAKINLTQGELKKQREKLRRYERFLPILYMKKQQLQMEIREVYKRIQAKNFEIENHEASIHRWSGLLQEDVKEVRKGIHVEELVTSGENIAGVVVPRFERIIFSDDEYDLYEVPMWADKGIEQIRKLVTVHNEKKIMIRQKNVLGEALRTTIQRVNLFEEIKIPECRSNIRRIRIALGDNQTSAVGRSKLAKHKLESIALGGRQP